MRDILKNPGLVEFLTTAQRLNPATVINASTLIPYKAVVNATGKNTTVKCFSDGALAGLVEFTFDRVDPAKLFNIFGDKTKRPVLNYFGDGGVSTTVATLATALNQKIGTQLQIGGVWPDFVDQSITTPLKGTSLTVNLATPNATGKSDVSLRLLPGKTLSFDLVNKGANLSEHLVARGIYPYKNADSTLNHIYTGAGNNTPLQMALFDMDFTEVFGTLTNVYSCLVGSGTRSPYNYRFTDAVRTAINTILTANGLPNILSTWYFTYSTNNAESAILASGTCNTKLNSVRTQADVNKRYDNSIRLPATAFETKAGVFNTTVYLNWNSLT